jgi:hypothetical protein
MDCWSDGFATLQYSTPEFFRPLGPKKVSYLLADAATEPLFQLEPNAQEPVAEKPGEGR